MIKHGAGQYLMNTDSNGLSVVRDVPRYIEVDTNISAIVSDVIRGIVRYAMPLNIASLHALFIALQMEQESAHLCEKLTDKELARVDNAIAAVDELFKVLILN